MADPPLLNDYEHDIKLNNPTPQSDDSPVLIVIDPPDPLDLLDPPVPYDTTIVLIETLQADTVITFSITILTTI